MKNKREKDNNKSPNNNKKMQLTKWIGKNRKESKEKTDEEKDPNYTKSNDSNKINKDIVQICVEDEDLVKKIDKEVGFECSDRNPYMIKWVEGVIEGKYHPNND